MSKELTEQWKKGELETGDYYVKPRNGQVFVYHINHSVKHIYHNHAGEIKEVLAPVPSYEEYLESESHCAVYSEVNKWLKQENKQLRQLLKECKDIIEWYKTDTGYVDLPTENILTRINAALGESEE